MRADFKIVFLMKQHALLTTFLMKNILIIYLTTARSDKPSDNYHLTLQFP